ncbi:hypothetical protein GCM10010342_56070 [Streptomyces anulatus]|nr:hypothetical protein GCM10010342_56070 [Streptomyces anulatus]
MAKVTSTGITTAASADTAPLSPHPSPLAGRRPRSPRSRPRERRRSDATGPFPGQDPGGVSELRIERVLDQ